jgi:ABC-type Mn2+/Zn2+ transport system ATPase subunit
LVREKYDSWVITHFHLLGPASQFPFSALQSSLASAVISEVPFVEGERTINGSIAYVPQEAWIINATVRDNILFGKPFDAALYRRVIHASALDADLKIMSAGDMTEIGDRGINLSGGQRQRVSIARALYADRDLLVLDDPLSAVDSHVAAHLVKHVIDNYIKKQGKSAVIVTNQLQFLPHADHIVLLKNGKIAEQGSFSQLNTNGKTFAQLVKDFGGIDSNKKHAEDTEESNAHFNEYVSRETSSDATNQLTGSEELETGSVSASVYWYYTRAGGWYWFFISTFLMVGIASIRIFHSLWLSWWSSPDPVVAGQHTKETCASSNSCFVF